MSLNKDDVVSLKRSCEHTDVVYSVVESHNLDDYKRRGSDWTTTTTSLFSEKEYAISYILRTKRALLKEWVDDLGPKDCLNEFGEEDPDIDKMDDIDMLNHFNEYNKGEYVPVSYSFQVDEQAIDTMITDDERGTKRAKK